MTDGQPKASRETHKKYILVYFYQETKSLVTVNTVDPCFCMFTAKVGKICRTSLRFCFLDHPARNVVVKAEQLWQKP